MKRNGLLILNLLLSFTLCIAQANLLQNGGFENGTGSNPDNWSTSHFWATTPQFDWENNTGRNGSQCVKITIDPSNPGDARWVQDVNGLTPGKWYNLKGWVKGSRIDSVNGKGANICLMDGFQSSEFLDGSFDWRELIISIPVETSSVQVGARLGFYAGDSYGTVWFDDLRLDDDYVRLDGNDVYLMLEKTDTARLSAAGMNLWIARLDSVFGAYLALTGNYPYAGNKQGIASVRQYPGGLAVAGNPIRWQQQYIGDALQLVADSGDWSFAILHELGHVFDDDGWNFLAEFWANFKMYFVLDSLQAKVVTNYPAPNSVYVGDEMASAYQARYAEEKLNYQHTGILGNYNGVFVHRFIEIQKIIGWGPFKQSFRALYQVASPPTTQIGRFYLFMDTLSHFAGQDIYQLIPQTDLNEFISYLNGEPVNQIPQAIAGAAASVPLGDTLWLNGQATDDGLPANGILSFQWSLINGPAGITIDDEFGDSTYAIFSQTGTYRLAFFVTDGRSYDRDTLEVNVTAPLNLPWKDVKIEVDPEQCKAHLSWEIPQAEDVAYFKILESLNGQDFFAIGELIWKPEQERYHFYRLLPALTSYYQIQAWSQNNLLSTSPMLAAFCSPANPLVQIYPNPITDGELHIRVFESKGSVLQWDLINLQGKRLQSWSESVSAGENFITKEISELPGGLYLLRLYGESTRVWRVMVK